MNKKKRPGIVPLDPITVARLAGTDQREAAIRTICDFVFALGRDTEAVAKRMNTDPIFVKRLAEYARRKNKETTSPQQARKIMGKNFFGLEEAKKYFGIDSANDSNFYEIGWGEKTLRKYSKTHLLIAVHNNSIVDICKKAGRSELIKSDSALDENAICTAGWYLIRKEPATGSIGRPWAEYESFLSVSDEEIPSAHVLIYGMIGYFLATGQKLCGEAKFYCHGRICDFRKESIIVRDTSFYDGTRKFKDTGLATVIRNPLWISLLNRRQK